MSQHGIRESGETKDRVAAGIFQKVRQMNGQCPLCQETVDDDKCCVSGPTSGEAVNGRTTWGDKKWRDVCMPEFPRHMPFCVLYGIARRPGGPDSSQQTKPCS